MRSFLIEIAISCKLEFSQQGHQLGADLCEAFNQQSIDTECKRFGAMDAYQVGLPPFLSPIQSGL
jgi:hypothetical protein